MDPVTPPHWGDFVKKNLTNAIHVVAPGGHHIITGEGCISQLVAAFIAKGDGKNLDRTCAQNIQPLAIHLPSSAIAKSTDSSAIKGAPETTNHLEKNADKNIGAQEQP
jgi:hypothetical protein